MDPIQERLAEWESAGLIDAATAERLRAAEAARGDVAPTPEPADAGPRGLAISSLFGPGVTVSEMFAYLGVGFLFGAWTAFVARMVGDQGDSTLSGVGMAIAAAALILMGIVLRRGDARRRRATGVVFLAAVAFVAAAATAFVARAGLDGVVVAIVVAASALIAAAVLRRIHPALLTQVGLLASVTGLGAALIAWAGTLLSAPQESPFDLPPTEDSANLVLRLVLTAAGWLVIALILGILALLEDPADDGSAVADADAARRRAALTRAWAGLVAVAGLSSAVTESHYINDNYGRVIPEWMAQLAILALAIVLVERAFRRDSGAFLLAAGIGFVIALTDFNFTYLTDSTEVGLLVEGGILLAIGFVADRLRRRLARGRSAGSPPRAETPPADPPPADPPPAEAPPAL